MSAVDKIKNAAEDLGGRAEEATGKVTDNERLEAEGKADQSEADLKQVGENTKDACRRD